MRARRSATAVFAAAVGALALGAPAAPAQTEAPPEGQVPTSAPDLVISGRDVRLTRAGILNVRIGCRQASQPATEACIGTLTLRLAEPVLVRERRGEREVTRRIAPFNLGTAQFTTPVNRAALLKIRVTPRTHRIVREVGRVAVEVISGYVSRAGATASARRTISVYFPRRPQPPI
jgi:hypothetical protein